jgi:prophage antirepressor-like protein
MSDITLFNFEGSQVRVSLDAKGEPWFVAKDICVAFDHSDVSVMVSRLDEEERGTSTVCTPGGVQELLTISESGLYSIILTSRKPNAKRFKRWVTSEVLPSIRKTGSYSRNPAPQQPQYIMKSDAESQASIIRDTMLFMQQLVPTIKPEMAAACTLRAMTAAGLMTKPTHEELRNVLSVEWDKAPSLTPTQIGDKIGGMDAKAVNKMLEAHGYQKKIGKRWEPTEAGLKYAGAVPYQAEHSQHKGVQLKWAPEICDILLALIKKGESTDLGLLT